MLCGLHKQNVLQKSLPLLRQSLATNELTIDGIRPPPPNMVFSMSGAAPTVQTVRTATPSGQQVRIVGPAATVVRTPGAPGTVLQHRLVSPLRGAVQQQPRMVILRPVRLYVSEVFF